MLYDGIWIYCTIWYIIYYTYFMCDILWIIYDIWWVVLINASNGYSCADDLDSESAGRCPARSGNDARVPFGGLSKIDKLLDEGQKWNRRSRFVQKCFFFWISASPFLITVFSRVEHVRKKNPRLSHRQFCHPPITEYAESIQQL